MRLIDPVHGTHRHVGSRHARLEDGPFVTGTSSYTGDLELPGMVHAAFVRSSVAHGVVGSVSWPRLHDSVTLIAGHDDIASWAQGAASNFWILPGQWQTARQLCDGRVRHVGDVVAVVVASSQAAATDAAECIDVEIDELPPVVGIDAALAASTVIEPGRPDNVMAAWQTGDDDAMCETVLASCDRTLRFSASVGRVAAAPMEPRAIVVDPGRVARDGRPEKVTIWTSTQAPHAVRDAVAEVTGLPQHRLRVIAPDVGGGFGVKDHAYDDELIVVLAAIRLGRPVKWVESRAESLTVTTQARGERYEVEVGFDLDGALRALRVWATRDCGAYLSVFGAGPLFAFTGTIPGPYRWEAVTAHATAVATTTCPTHSYRGFGQTQATFVRELAVDMVAAELGIDRFALRIANCVTPEQQPWQPRTSPMKYDGGDYGESVRRAEAHARSWGDPPDDGRDWGVGVATYVQMAGVGPSQGNPYIGLRIGSWEAAVVRMEPDASVRAYIGVSPQGQGHLTTFAQLIADRLGVDIEQIEVIHSDTDVTPYSAYGTAASRAISVGGGAVVLASEELADQLARIAAHLLEAAPADIVLADGNASVRGTPLRSVALRDVAARAWQGWDLPEGVTPGLQTRASYDPTNFTWSYSTHVSRVAVDPDTGQVEVDRYAVVLDCGTVVNPMIVEGQVHGGIAQGLGPALFEEVVHDENGQPRTAGLHEYLLPTATTMPSITVELMQTASPFTPGGMKGMGEGGTNGGFSCVVNAVRAAVGPGAAAALTHTPLTPERIVRAAGRIGALR